MNRPLFPLLLSLLAACSSAPKQAVLARPTPSVAPTPAPPDNAIPERVLDEVDALVTDLFVYDIAIRAHAARALGDHGPAARRAVPYLVDCVIGEDEPSELCADSLGRIGPLALPSIERILEINSDKALLGVRALDAMVAAGYEVPAELTAERSRVIERPGSNAGG